MNRRRFLAALPSLAIAPAVDVESDIVLPPPVALRPAVTFANKATSSGRWWFINGATPCTIDGKTIEPFQRIEIVPHGDGNGVTFRLPSEEEDHADDAEQFARTAATELMTMEEFREMTGSGEEANE